MVGRGGAGKEQRLIQVVRAEWKQIALAPESSVLVGFSGGRDSTALLAALRPVVANLHALHVDHAVREESAGDAEHASVVARRLGVPFTSKRLADDVAAMHPGVGLEEALRRERYLVFAEVSESVGAGIVALGHHAQDQAETVLLHLLRGSGLSGVVGMRSVSEIRVPWWGDVAPRSLRLWRPLLEVQPAELDFFIAASGLPVVADLSNNDRRFRRNAIRHDVLPLLDQISPGAVGNLARFGALVGDEDAFLESLAVAALGDVELLARSTLAGLPRVIQRRMVRIWLRRHLGEIEVSRNRIDAVVLAASEQRGPVTIEIGGGWDVQVDREFLSITVRLR
ncbi:MAG: tRNA lysidine(34) synthetase TilS [Thermomicrobiales bacterium]